MQLTMYHWWQMSDQIKSTVSWWCSIVVRLPVLAGELSLSCARLMAGCVTTLWLSVRYQSTNMGNSAYHPSGVG